MTLWLTLPLLLLIVVTALCAILMRDLIGAVFILGGYSFILALLWVWFGAADVGFTEAVVGAGLSTVFFLLALFLTSPRETRDHHHRVSWSGLVVLMGLAVLLLTAAKDLPVLGDLASPANTHISPEYLTRSLEDTRTPSVVASIIMDYRGLDTIIETAVIFTAGIACRFLLRRDG